MLDQCSNKEKENMPRILLILHFCKALDTLEMPFIFNSLKIFKFVVLLKTKAMWSRKWAKRQPEPLKLNWIDSYPPNF